MSFTIDKVYRSPFRAETMFRAWTSPDMAVAPVTKIEIEARKAGLIKLYVETEEYRSVMCGKFIEFHMNKHLKYSWQWADNQEITEVEIFFEATSEGCTIHLKHLGFQTKESQDLHDSGWDHYLQELHKKINAA